MNRAQLVQRTAEVLRERDAKKPISIPKYVLHVSDDDGNMRDFSVKRRDKTAIYTKEDVAAVIDACLSVVEELIRNGDEITIHGFGCLGVKYRAPRTTKRIDTGEDIAVPGRYVPRFIPGKNLKVCARVYELSLDEKNRDEELDSVDDESEEE